MAAAGLTITYERASVVDFTMPFLNLGITIIYKKPVKSVPGLFSFLHPLQKAVWIYMIAAYLCVSLMLFVIARWVLFVRASCMFKLQECLNCIVYVLLSPQWVTPEQIYFIVHSYHMYMEFGCKKGLSGQIECAHLSFLLVMHTRWTSPCCQIINIEKHFAFNKIVQEKCFIEKSNCMP